MRLQHNREINTHKSWSEGTVWEWRCYVTMISGDVRDECGILMAEYRKEWRAVETHFGLRVP